MVLRIHLNKSGSGMASMTACGRNILRTQLSTKWEEFKNLPANDQCEKCAASKQAEVNKKCDAKKEQLSLDKWEPMDDPDAWKAADDALIVAKKV